MREVERLEKLRKMAIEISYQAMDQDYHNDETRLKKALSIVSRSLGMIFELEKERIRDANKKNQLLGYLEGQLEVALDCIMNPTIDDKFINKPEPYVYKSKKN